MIFLDATVLAGAGDRRDDHHDDATAVMAAVATGRLGTALTSELVISEATTILGNRPRIGPAAAVAYVIRLLSSPRVRLQRLDDDTFAETLAVYARFGPALSMADCSTVVLMAHAGCKVLYSHDSDFDRFPRLERRERPE